MHLKFDWVYKIFMGSMLIALLCAYWVQAQPVVITNSIIRGPQASLERVPGSALGFGLDKVPGLQRTVFQIPLWQYLASFLFILLAFSLAKILDHFLATRLKRWARRTPTFMDDLFFELLEGPIKLVAFAVLLHIGLNVFIWPDWFKRFFSKGLKVLVAISVTYCLLRLADIVMAHWQRRARQEPDRSHEQILPIIRNSAKVFIVVVAVLFTLQNLDINITSLIASLSIGGLALGLAAQDTLANLFGAVAVLVDKPFRVGDRIKLDQIEGVVEELGFRSTRLRNADGYVVIIPNKTVGNATITNIARRPTIRTVLNLGLAYDLSSAQVRRAIEIIREVYGKHPMTQDVTASLTRFTDASLNVEVVHLWKTLDQLAYLEGMQEMHLEIKRRFDDEKICFAYPQSPFYLKPPG